MTLSRNREIAIVGAGIAGVATAYYLCTRFGKSSVLLIDPRQPLSYTSAQSGDNYRNWWPHPTMVAFTDHSIGLMDDIARATGDDFGMTRRGYVLATRRTEIDDLLDGLAGGYGTDNPADVDVVRDTKTIRANFPALTPDIRSVMHIRRAGDFDSQRLGTLMLDAIRAAGGAQLRGELQAVSAGDGFALDVRTATGQETIRADVVINAAGPFAARVAAMLGIELPVANVFQQKIAFDDDRAAVDRDLPFVIDLDPVTLDWPEETRELLAADDELAWLVGPMPGGRHCRPDGGSGSRRVKLGWAYNRLPSEPQQDLAGEPLLDDTFPEIVIRGAATLLPALAPYIHAPPERFFHYGGYYTMTPENWPLIGPLGPDGAFMVTALSGFGSMAACAAGLTCAAWACNAPLPDYAVDLSLARYDNPDRVRSLEAMALRSIL